jgi:Raf kinase inhibitor-like YbhB/YbcL family protein
MQLSSTAFSAGTFIPRRFTCDGANVSPPFDWSGAPKTTCSFALLCDDPDAPARTWRHWAAYDIPADQTALAEGSAQRAGNAAFKQAINDFQRRGYGGPCPPHNHGLHHYHFRLLALSVDRLPLGDKPSCREVEREARKHVILEAELTGIYER